MDADLAVSSVSADRWETKHISKCMARHKSYQYRYSIWIEVLALLANGRTFFIIIIMQDIKYCSVD